jgi:glycine cleavage system H protein
MSGKLYSPRHIWVRLLPGGEALLGVTQQLVRSEKKPACVNLCDPGDTLRVGDWMGDIEFYKGVFDLRCPVEGTVCAVNAQAILTPQTLQGDETWLVRLRDVRVPRKLLDTAEYLRVLQEERNKR